MSDKKKTFEEKIYDAFPEDWKPDYKPIEVDTSTASFGEIVEASQIREIFKSFIIDETDKQMFDVFIDGLINKHSSTLDEMRDRLKDPKTKLELIKELALRTGYGKRS